jgi:hypothetical protein
MLLRESRFGMLFKSLIVRVRKRVQQRSGQKVRLGLVITMGLVSWGLIQIKQAECMYEPSPTDEGATPALARLPRALTRREHYQQAGRANILPPLVGVAAHSKHLFVGLCTHQFKYVLLSRPRPCESLPRRMWPAEGVYSEDWVPSRTSIKLRQWFSPPD